MSQELVVKDDRTLADDLETTVIATNAQQMQAAQLVLVERMQGRLSHLAQELGELEHNLEIAKKNKLRLSTIVTAIAKVKKRIVFYEKLKAAFEAGYTLIPNMNVDVFAIRTTRRRPSGSAMDRGHPIRTPWISDQETNAAAIGEGHYVSQRALVQTSDSQESGKDGTLIPVRQAWASEFTDEIDFPFALAKPQIVEMTTRAMALKVFDDFGVLPNSRRGDPMVVGRIILKQGAYQTRTMNFLICWFVNTRDI